MCNYDDLSALPNSRELIPRHNCKCVCSLQGDGVLWTECLGLQWVFRSLLPGHLAGVTRTEIHVPVRRSFEFICDVVWYCVIRGIGKTFHWGGWGGGHSL